MNQCELRQFLIQELIKENNSYNGISFPINTDNQKQLLRGLMNQRISKNISDSFLVMQDEYLKKETAQKGIIRLKDLSPIKDFIYLWQGDITTLQCDSIVNAANSGMTGCYIPNHKCIDNCIHSFAGIQLRLECERIMCKQGFKEPTGKAKITKAYNLPCNYILHTVGPIINGSLTKNDCDLLASCYHSCLELATEKKLENVAFCCISTGEFRFPNDRAAEIAVQTVMQFMKKETSVKKVIFNVFKDIDKKIYTKLLR